MKARPRDPISFPLGWEENKHIGIYGNKGPFIIVLHAGPGATGRSEIIA